MWLFVCFVFSFCLTSSSPWNLRTHFWESLDTSASSRSRLSTHSTVTSEIPTARTWKPMDSAFTAQLSTRTSISGSQLSTPEFPRAISQLITLFFSYTEVQCMKSSFCFNFVSQDQSITFLPKWNIHTLTCQTILKSHTYTHTPLHPVLPLPPKVLGPVTCQGPACFCRHTEGSPPYSSAHPSAPRKIPTSALLPPAPSLSLNSEAFLVLFSHLAFKEVKKRIRVLNLCRVSIPFFSHNPISHFFYLSECLNNVYLFEILSRSLHFFR